MAVKRNWIVRSIVTIAALWSVLSATAAGQDILVKPEHEHGLYQPDEVIRWNVEVKDAEASEATFVVKKGGMTEVARGTVTLSQGKGQIEARLGEPGWLLTEVIIPGSDSKKKAKALGGALVSHEKLRPASNRPDDFDAFWKGKLKDLAAVPANPQLIRGDSGKPDVEYHKITMDNIRGSHIHGQFARPRKGDKFPAMFIVQWAGVYPLQKVWVTSRAAEGWLVLNINAHDLPIDEPEQFYKDQAAGPLKDYPAIGNSDRETSYFLRMYLSCYRGAQYLAERPDWDGHTLVVTGSSQGGLQSIVTAALHPKVTAALACVPAGCDLNGPRDGRLPGWPMWYWKTEGKDEAKVREAARYYDVANFASLVRCPVLVGVGLIDTTCPSPGIFAACNLLKGPKEIVVLPLAEHGDTHGSHRPYQTRFDAWNKALVKGDPAPVVPLRADQP